MNSTDITGRPTYRRGSLVAMAIVVALALLVVGVRQVTIEVRGGEQPASAVGAVTDRAGVAETERALAGTESGSALDDELRSEGGAPAPASATIGPVVADDDYVFAPGPDQVSIEPGAGTDARAAPQVPGDSDQGGSAPDTEDDDESDDGPGPVYGPADGSPKGGSIPVDPGSTVGADVKVTFGSYATVSVGLGGGLDGGLAALRIDFGDGSKLLELEDFRIALVRNGGRVRVSHQYEPTLTPREWTAVVVAVDGAGQIYERTLQFETRAAFQLVYTSLKVTALSKCDSFGKGDFELTWQNDASLPLGKTSTFKLGRNESYQEAGFATLVRGAGPEPAFRSFYYQELPELFLVDGKAEFLYLKLTKKDSFAGTLLEVLARRAEFPDVFSPYPWSFFTDGPVAQLGNHHYEVTVRTNEPRCKFELAFIAELWMQLPPSPGG